MLAEDVFKGAGGLLCAVIVYGMWPSWSRHMNSRVCIGLLSGVTMMMLLRGSVSPGAALWVDTVSNGNYQFDAVVIPGLLGATSLLFFDRLLL